MSIGQADGANPINAPGSDGGGSGVPDNSVIRNVTNLANSVAVDVAGVFRTVNSPPPAQPYTFGGGGMNQPVIFGLGIVPLLLLGFAAYLIFK